MDFGNQYNPCGLKEENWNESNTGVFILPVGHPKHGNASVKQYTRPTYDKLAALEYINVEQNI